MPAQFDPYHKWLGIPPKEQPPTHYRLLGLAPLEADPEVIDAAANRLMAYVQSCATGPHVKASQQLLNEIAAARLCLLDPKKREAYNARSGLNAAGKKLARAKPLGETAEQTFTIVPEASLRPSKHASQTARRSKTAAKEKPLPSWVVPTTLVGCVVALVVVAVVLFTRGDGEGEQADSDKTPPAKQADADKPAETPAGGDATAASPAKNDKPAVPMAEDKPKPAADAVLKLVAAGGAAAALKELIAAQAPLDAQDESGRTALRLAIANKRLDLAKELIAAKANVTIADAKGGTPLMAAAQAGDLELVDLLMQHGALGNAATPVADGDGGVTALLVAARHGHVDVAKSLLDKGASADLADGAGVTPLMVAAWQGHLPLVELLIANRANVNAADANGQTPLMYAAAADKLECVEALLLKGASSTAKRSDGATALSIAEGSGALAVVASLREAQNSAAP